MSDTKDKSISLTKGYFAKFLKQQTEFIRNDPREEFCLTPMVVELILKECLTDLLRGQPELSPQTMRWLNKWFGTDYT
jgi:hypothetical protein